MTSVQVRYHAAMPNSTICYQQIRLMLVSSQESRVGKKRYIPGHLGTYVGPLIPRLIRAADSCGLASREITMTPNNFSNLVKIAPIVSKTERLFCPESPSWVASTIRAVLKQVPDAAKTHTNWCSFKRVLGALHLDVLVGRGSVLTREYTEERAASSRGV